MTRIDSTDPYVPEYFGIKLYVVAALGWLAAWVVAPWTFGAWALILAVYVVTLSVFSLARALLPQSTVGHEDWIRSFFRTAGWFVLSGLASIVVYATAVLVSIWYRGDQVSPQ